MKILQIIPELLVEDMQKTLRFYQEILGFKPEIVYPQANPVFVQIRRDNIRIMLYDRSDFENEIPKLKKVKMGGSVLLYIEAEKIETFYQEIKDRVNIIQPIHKTDYGSLEFTIEDCNGYLIAFSESISEARRVGSSTDSR